MQAQIRAAIRSVLADRENEINGALAAAKAAMAAESGRAEQIRQSLRQANQASVALRQEASVLTDHSFVP